MSKLSITFQFDSEADAQAFLAKISPTIPAVGVKAEVTVEVPARVRVRKATEKKADTPVTANTGAAAAGTPPNGEAGGVPLPSGPSLAPVPVTAPKVPVGTASQEDVRSALRAVFNTKGAGAATELLKRFSATSVSTVKPEQYADFIKACL